MESAADAPNNSLIRLAFLSPPFVALPAFIELAATTLTFVDDAIEELRERSPPPSLRGPPNAPAPDSYPKLNLDGGSERYNKDIFAWVFKQFRI